MKGILIIAMRSFRAQVSRFLYASVLAFAALAGSAVLAAPSGTPPENNVPVPLNASANTQVKAGDLTVGSLSGDQFCIGASCISDWSEKKASECHLGVPQAAPSNSWVVAQTAGFVVYSQSCSSHISGSVSLNGATLNTSDRKGSGQSGSSITLPVPEGASWYAGIHNGCYWTGTWWVPLTCTQ